MTLIIFTDIYGVTPQWITLISSLASKNITIELVSPYTEQHSTGTLNDVPLYSFEDEQNAYDFFISQGGHDHYQSVCQQVLTSASSSQSSQAKKVVVMGFSAGASAAWRALCKQQNVASTSLQCSHFIGFYPSYIRYFTHLMPSCPTTFIFPVSETHFDVKQVSDALADKPNVYCINTPNQHGFLNSLSKSYLHHEYLLLTETLKNEEHLSTPVAFQSAFYQQSLQQGQ